VGALQPQSWHALPAREADEQLRVSVAERIAEPGGTPAATSNRSRPRRALYPPWLFGRRRSAGRRHPFVLTFQALDLSQLKLSDAISLEFN
jgi:hypothetical protein